MARRILTLLALAASAIGVAQAQITPNDVTNLGWSIKPGTHTKGKAVTIQGRILIKTFADAENVECGFERDPATIKWGLNNQKTKVQKYKKGIDYKLTTESNLKEVAWVWNKAGSAASTNKVWTLYAKVTLDPATTLTSYKWKFFCLAQFADPNRAEETYFEVEKTLPIVAK